MIQHQATAPSKIANLAHSAHPAYRADIDGLRAVAVLSVVLFHAFPAGLRGGFIGVDVFFVISGFLISTIIFGGLERGSFSFADFYARRVKRIFPALVLVLAATYAFGWFALLADEYKQLGKHIAGGAGFVSNLVLWSESGYFDNTAETKPLLHLWSLGIEEQFYFVWPPLMWFAWKRKLNLFTIAIVVALISFGLNLKGIGKDAIGTFYSPQTRFWELACGSLLAWTSLYKKALLAPVAARLDRWFAAAIYRDARPAGTTLANVLSLSGALLLLYGLVRMDKFLAFPGKWAVLPVLGAVLIIAAGPRAWSNRVLLSNKVVVWFGLISFPLYLWHWPLLSYTRILESGLPDARIRVAAVLLAVGLAWLTYRLVERHMRYGGHGSIKVVSLVLAMSALGAIGYATYAHDGLGFRAAQQVLNVNDFDVHYKESCAAFTGMPDPRHDWCNAGTSNSRPSSTVLIGDSFSNAYSTMLNAYAADAGTAFSFIQSGRGLCPALLGYGPDFCQVIASKDLDYVKANPNVKYVVFAARWPTYYGVATYEGMNENMEAFKVALDRTLKAYKELGKQIVFLLPPPTGAEPRSCVIRPLRITQTNSCDLTIAKARENEGQFRTYLLPLLAQQKIPYFDPFNYFCDTSLCYVSKHGKIFYADEGHMSPFGGQFLAKEAKSELDKLFEIRR